MRSLLAQNCKSDQDDRLVFSLLTFRKLLKGQSVLWLKLNKLDLGGEKVSASSLPLKMGKKAQLQNRPQLCILKHMQETHTTHCI